MTAQPLQVLVLEDTEADRLFVQDALVGGSAFQFDVRFADTVAELIAKARQVPPDVALIDLCVPDSAGLPTWRAVSAGIPGTPIVVQSGLQDEELAIQALGEGAQDYLVKGRFSHSQLVRALRFAVQRHTTEAALRLTQQRYQLAAEGSNDGIWDWDLHCGELWLSPRWTAIVGLPQDALRDDPAGWMALVHPDDVDGFAAAIMAHSDGLSSHLEHEHRMRHADGQWRWVLCRGLATRDDQGRAVRMAGSLTDATARKQAEERLLHDALHDRLTGLANRVLCLDRIALALSRARRSPERRFAVLFLDLDRFKLVNDSLGHLAGDALLVEMADRLRLTVRPSDTVARMGGDEFCVVLEDIGGPTAAMRIAERIQAALAAPVALAGTEVVVTASIGIALHDPAHQRPEDLIRDADMAMYRAKEGGKARHKVSDSGLHLMAVEQLELETDLRRSVARGELGVVFQPIVALATGHVVGVEALARWQHPQRGAVAPDKFIAFAEETGLIVELGRHLIDRTLSLFAAFERAHPDRRGQLRVAVNLSPRQFWEPDLVSELLDTMHRHEFAPQRLVLEITESALMRDWRQAAAMLDPLRKLGVRVHLDDFGTGYSSLSQLQRLPLDTLKIDRSFVTGLGDRLADLEIVRAVATMAHTLGKTVVAEGIEQPGQYEAVRALGIQEAQGWLFGKPVSALHDIAVTWTQRSEQAGRLPAGPRRTAPVVVAGAALHAG
ncbi:MAG: EAL domain-containing protein [Deltaproteobacteria bacterium]|nr:EAL domain-containing protein [Deltaproteobacteria bacterium]